jgi:hypothetical protein
VAGSNLKQVRPSSESLDDSGDINRARENITYICVCVCVCIYIYIYIYIYMS